MLFILNLIGLGLGPLIAGITSDVLRDRFVSGGMSEPAALAEGLRWSLRVMVVVNLWSALHYFLAARTLRAEEAPG